jgi:hypothetical protein
MVRNGRTGRGLARAVGSVALLVCLTASLSARPATANALLGARAPVARQATHSGALVGPGRTSGPVGSLGQRPRGAQWRVGSAGRRAWSTPPAGLRAALPSTASAGAHAIGGKGGTSRAFTTTSITVT